MKRLILTSVSAAALAVGAAHAADYAPPPVAPDPFYNWNGPYIGGNFGYSILDGTISASDFIGSATSSMDDDDITFGGQVGWNFQQDMWLFGVEGDFNYLDLRDSISFTGKGTTTARADYDWFATLRGRAGILVNPSLLIYGTGGVAFIESDLRVTSLGGAASDTDVLVGWTAGAGIEYAFTESLSAKVEYLYADFEDHSITGVGAFGGAGSAEPELHIFRAGLNWHFCTGLGC
jgi:outer membrane immunogenic protein